VTTSVIFAIALLVTGLFVREIVQQSELLNEQVSAVQKDQARQEQLNRLNRLAAETDDTRRTVESFYLASLDDRIDFLNYIERLATTQGIALETISAPVEERDNKQLLTVEYELAGSRQQLESFIALLENIPFVSEVVSVSLSKRTAANWEAGVTMEVIVLDTYETTN
jgi:hypothetical protein